MGQWRAVPRCNFSLLCRIGHKDSVPLANEFDSWPWYLTRKREWDNQGQGQLAQVSSDDTSREQTWGLVESYRVGLKRLAE